MTYINIEDKKKLNLGNKGKGKGLTIRRFLTKPGQFAYDTKTWVKKDITMWSGNKVTFHRADVEVPEDWGDKALQITASKYLYGSREDEAEYEKSFKNLFDRIANTYTVWGWQLGYFKDVASAENYNQEMKYMLLHQMWAPNSPVWFNLGQWEQWRWGRPDLRKRIENRGITAYSVTDEENPRIENAKAYKNPLEHPQASACFILGVEDSMESILKHQYTEGSVFSSGSGVGINISTLRSSGEPISGKGTASGPLGFNAGWDKMAGAIKSGGKTRRAARMVVLYSDHPDVFDFVKAKFNQEEIAKVIVKEHNVLVGLRTFAEEKLKNGNPAEKLAAKQLLAFPMVNDTNYSAGMDDLLYGQTLSNQNANHTVSLKAGFWVAYKNGTKYATRWVKDPKHIVREYMPDELLTEMSDAIWSSAEPGVHNNDIINFWSTFKDELEIETSNPCSEYLGPTFSSCNLSSFNLIRFYNSKTGQFNIGDFSHCIEIAMIAADINVSQGGFPTKELAVNTVKYRTTGIGFANIGGLLMSIGVPYDSDRGRAIAASIASFLTSTCYLTSSRLAEILGTYPAYKATEGSLNRVINMQTRMSEELYNLVSGGKTMPSDFSWSADLPCEDSFTPDDAIKAFHKSIGKELRLPETWVKTAEMAAMTWHAVRSLPLRNSFVTCIAPTGTISAPMGIYEEGTTSAEPEYSLVKYKALSGGGSMILINGMLPKGLIALGYDQNTVLRAVADVSGLAGLEQYMSVAGIKTTLGVGKLRDILHSGGEVSRAIANKLESIANDEEYNAFVGNLKVSASKGLLSADELYYYTGQKHLENLGFNEETLRVFDCAAKPWGAKRSIAVDGHLRMLGALQPFISGATSKTVNMPADATKADIHKALTHAHEYGVKCIAIYRDTSRAQEVYSTSVTSPYVQNAWNKLIAEAKNTLAQECGKPKHKKLPFRRPAETIKFVVGGIEGFLTVGTYSDGTCAEIFGRLGQGGSIAYGMFDAFCKAFSVGLQYGIPLSSYIKKFRYLTFDPNGFVQVGDNSGDENDPGIHSCKSIIDLLMQLLEWLFPEETGRRIRPLQGVEYKLSQNEGELTVEPMDMSDSAKSAALPCPKCGSLEYVFDGHCRSCRSCGFKDGGCGA